MNCYASDFHDRASCSAESWYGCRGNFYESSSCTAAGSHGCGMAQFHNNSSCVATGEYGCDGAHFFDNSYCEARVLNGCPSNSWDYTYPAYCKGPYCAAGTQRQDGSVRTEMGE